MSGTDRIDFTTMTLDETSEQLTTLGNEKICCLPRGRIINLGCGGSVAEDGSGRKLLQRPGLERGWVFRNWLIRAA